MLMEEKIDIKKEAQILIDGIVRELVANYGKKLEEAKHLVKGMDVYQAILDDPIRLHESAEKWALILLIHYNDFEALEKYYLE